MREAAAAIAAEAQEAGYWGPCGVDGFAFRGPGADAPDAGDRPALTLRPIVEFNARFTVGIVVAGLLRRAAARMGPALGLEPGERRGFLFALDPPAGWPDWSSFAEAAGPGALLLPLDPNRAAPASDAEPAARAPARPALLFAPEVGALRAALRARESRPA
jgi:hypothetical protein